MLFERRGEPLLPWRSFALRAARYASASAGLLLGSLLIGVLGYRLIAQLSWIDALLNACFILTGMGPVQPLSTSGAKLFAAGYAIFSGVIFLSSVAVLLSPGVHRLLHHFHLDIDKD